MRDIEASVDGPLSIEFNEAVQRGTGKIQLLDSQGKLVHAWDIADAAVQANIVTLDRGPVLTPSRYKVVLDEGAVKDMAGLPAGGTYEVEIRTTAGGGDALGPVASPFDQAARGSEPSHEDAAVLPGKPADYQIANEMGYERGTVTGDNGRLSLYSIEYLLFTDSPDAIGLSLDGYLGKAYRMYQTVFDRAPDKEGLGFWAAHQQQGLTLESMAAGFMNSPEFIGRYGRDPANEEFVANLYRNVLHREGEAQGMAYHIANLERGMSKANVVVGFSESPENQQQVAKLVGDWFEFTPLG